MLKLILMLTLISLASCAWAAESPAGNGQTSDLQIESKLPELTTAPSPVVESIYTLQSLLEPTDKAVPAPVPVAIPVVEGAAVKEVKANVLAATLLSGDFRYRLQSETQEPKDQRKLQRLQVRLQAAAEVHDNLKIVLRLMTGSSANSGNQTMGDEKAPGMVRRNFGLDQAYFDYQPFKVWNLYGGKMPQPLLFVGKNQMILDKDITLEGLATKFKIDLDDKFNFFVQGGAFLIRENYDSLFNEDQSDNMLNVGQVGLQWKKDDWDIILGYGSFGFSKLKDAPPSSLTIGGGANGNTLDATGNYPANFDLQEYFIEMKKKIFEVEISLFYESVNNQDIDVLNKATVYGLTAGYKKVTLGWMQQQVQKDAVVGLFTDSDFAGGQTSGQGTVFSLNYKISKKVQLQYTVFKNKNSIDTVASNYDRNHIDLMISF